MKNYFLKLLIAGLLFANTLNAQVADSISLQKYNAVQRFVNVLVDGKNYHFLFDTGAGSTFISEELANSLKMKTTGTATVFSKEGTRKYFKQGTSVMLQIGKTFLMQKQVIISDQLNAPNITFQKLDGIISLKTFEGQIVTVDFEHNVLLIESSQSYASKIKTMAAIDVVFSNGINGNELNALISTKVKDKSLLMKFDTGNNDRVLLSKQSAKELNLLPDSLLQSNEPVKTGDVGFVLQSSIAENEATLTKDLIYDGVFNYNFISGYAFTFDLIKQKAFVLPY